jgi:hypothetical protein
MTRVRIFGSADSQSKLLWCASLATDFMRILQWHYRTAANEPERLGGRGCLTCLLRSDRGCISSLRTANLRPAQAFLRELPLRTGIKPSQILFIIDGFRYPSSSDAEEAARLASFFNDMRNFFIAEAKMSGFHVADMDESFLPDFIINKKRFDYPTDGHWNSHAHELAAQRVLRSAFIPAAFPSTALATSR